MWCRRLADHDTLVPPIRLRRAIEKLIALPRNINSLLCFAFSPRKRKIFRNTILQIIPVDHQTPLAGNWPSDAQEWQEFQQRIYNRHNLEDARRPDEKTDFERLLKGGKQIVHCECAVISFLHRQPSLPAFGYIGVSKLSCKACFLWLSAYNRHANSAQYRIRGAIDKWYMGWQKPVLDQTTQAKVDDALFKMIEKEFCEIQKDIGNARVKPYRPIFRLTHDRQERKRDTPGFDLGLRRTE
jgi:hypothetical protein